MFAEKQLPVVHRVFAGELKHHFLLKNGQLGYQKTALNAHSPRQRIGYQMLADESGAAFVDLYPLIDADKPRLELVYAFLALAWSAPVAMQSPSRTLDLPDVLSISRKAVSQKAYQELQETSQELGFRIEHPKNGFDAGVHLVKHISQALDTIRWVGDLSDVDWTAGANMEILSHLVAGRISGVLVCNAPMYAFRLGVFDNTPRYVHRPVPQEWFAKIAQIYGDSAEEFQSLCTPFFVKRETPE